MISTMLWQQSHPNLSYCCRGVAEGAELTCSAVRDRRQGHRRQVPGHTASVSRSRPRARQQRMVGKTDLYAAGDARKQVASPAITKDIQAGHRPHGTGETSRTTDKKVTSATLGPCNSPYTETRYASLSAVTVLSCVTTCCVSTAFCDPQPPMGLALASPQIVAWVGRSTAATRAALRSSYSLLSRCTSLTRMPYPQRFGLLKFVFFRETVPLDGVPLRAAAVAADGFMLAGFHCATVSAAAERPADRLTAAAD